MTISGMPRSIQRKMYDKQRKEVIPQHGIRVIVISFSDFGSSKKLKLNREKDLKVVDNLLK